MIIRQDVLDFIIDHARHSAPAECCGILLSPDNDTQTIIRAMRAENPEAACTSPKYVLDHKTHLKAIDMELSSGVRIVGYYHSHPTGEPRPSPSDREAAVPEPVYLIVSAASEPARHAAWRMDKCEFVRVPLEVR